MNYEARKYAIGVLRVRQRSLEASAKSSNDAPYIERQEKFIGYLDHIIDELNK